MSVYPRIVELVDGTETTDDAVKARCALALQLAIKLDEAVADSSSTSAMAVPGLSKELRFAIDEISSVEGRKEAFRADIFRDEEDAVSV